MHTLIYYPHTTHKHVHTHFNNSINTNNYDSTKKTTTVKWETENPVNNSMNTTKKTNE